MTRFQDKVVLITGASQGIGQATAERFAAESAVVAMNHFRQQEKAEAIAGQIRQHGGRAEIFEADVSDRQAVAKMVEDIEAKLGEIDILVNNAGIASHIPFLKLAAEEWDRVLAVNLGGTFNCCKAVAPSMARRRAGKIINVASELGLVGAPTLVHYSASKGGVIAMSKALARELAALGVNVNVVAPGPTETELLTAYPEEFNEQTLATIPLRRWGQPRDIAATIAFLASEDASFYAGWVLSPNGGVVM
jgi:3-oxoacyl-[acyl-carrier protein] reductase